MFKIIKKENGITSASKEKNRDNQIAELTTIIDLQNDTSTMELLS